MNYKAGALAVAALSASLSSAEAAKKQPNVIVILADDLGYADVGFTGCKDIRTPNLDQLAKEGVVCTNGYANHPFSGPSRAALMSGRYPYRFGFEMNPGHDPNSMQGVPTTEKIFPQRMQEVGYKTAGFGKWHLGAAEPLLPWNRGFDYFYGFIGGSHSYYISKVTDPIDNGLTGAMMRNNKPETFEGYLTRVLSAEAVKFVEENKSDPFFIYLSYNAPHAPLQAPSADKARYADIKDPKRQTYAAMVDIMDEGVGDVVEALKRNKIYEDTLIFFLSDNGGPEGTSSSNKPFKGQKGSLNEGGVHVPFLVSWPAQIKGGRVYEYPVNSIDISRTAVAVAGANATSALGMDGVDLIPFLTGKQKGEPHDMIFWRAGNNASQSAVSADGYKYLKKGKNPVEIYNLREDIGETKSIAAGSADKTKKMKAAIDEWNKTNVPNVIVPMKH
ncbi:MAG: sulfatase-like hydrolase/transferase [Rikenellaceae bacterium]